jgi:FkbM family methyltransferase
LSLTTALRERLAAPLRRLPWLYQPLQRGYRRLVPVPHPLEAQIEAALRGLTRVHFVQVGSNDGAQGDPIHRLIRRHRGWFGLGGWQGIFIEPVPYLYARLKANYGSARRFVFENVAIGEQAGTARFYYVSDRAKEGLGEELPYWYDQLGSFDRGHILKHLDGRLEPYIVEAELACLPLQAVLDRNHAERVDLLHIDTEGYDYQVLKQFDLARYRPRVVLYEHKHLPEDQQQAARALLGSQGYELRRRGGDTLAIRLGS